METQKEPAYIEGKTIRVNSEDLILPNSYSARKVQVAEQLTSCKATRTQTVKSLPQTEVTGQEGLTDNIPKFLFIKETIAGILTNEFRQGKISMNELIKLRKEHGIKC